MFDLGAGAANGVLSAMKVGVVGGAFLDGEEMAIEEFVGGGEFAGDPGFVGGVEEMREGVGPGIGEAEMAADPGGKSRGLRGIEGEEGVGGGLMMETPPLCCRGAALKAFADGAVKEGETIVFGGGQSCQDHGVDETAGDGEAGQGTGFAPLPEVDFQAQGGSEFEELEEFFPAVGGGFLGDLSEPLIEEFVDIVGKPCGGARFELESLGGGDQSAPFDPVADELDGEEGVAAGS